jgi:hypothetical protein
VSSIVPEALPAIIVKVSLKYQGTAPGDGLPLGLTDALGLMDIDGERLGEIDGDTL